MVTKKCSTWPGARLSFGPIWFFLHLLSDSPEASHLLRLVEDLSLERVIIEEVVHIAILCRKKLLLVCVCVCHTGCGCPCHCTCWVRVCVSLCVCACACVSVCESQSALSHNIYNCKNNEKQEMASFLQPRLRAVTESHQGCKCRCVCVCVCKYRKGRDSTASNYSAPWSLSSLYTGSNWHCSTQLDRVQINKYNSLTLKAVLFVHFCLSFHFPFLIFSMPFESDFLTLNDISVVESYEAVRQWNFNI